jgi:transcriptional accessory protein Tex/SPT6
VDRLEDPDRQVLTVADVLLGVGHILAEDFSERADLRGRLRRIFFRSGQLICTKIEKPPEAEGTGEQASADEAERGKTQPVHTISFVVRSEAGFRPPSGAIKVTAGLGPEFAFLGETRARRRLSAAA